MIGHLGFVRSRRRWGAWAGLAALLLQIAMSFGHMHPDDLGISPPLAASHDQVIAVGASAATIPAEQDHRPAPDDYCPICATMALAATAMPSLPPALVTPIALHFFWRPSTAIEDLSPRLTLSFQARAPPSI